MNNSYKQKKSDAIYGLCDCPGECQLHSYKQKKLKTLVEYDGVWHKQGANRNCEKFTMKDLENLIDETEKQAYERGRENKIPMGVSQWKNHGIKYGYWDYFLEQAQSEMREDLVKWAEDRKQKTQKSDRPEIGLYHDISDLDDLINYLNKSK